MEEARGRAAVEHRAGLKCQDDGKPQRDGLGKKTHTHTLYPLVMTNIAIGHRNSEFTHKKWW